MIWGSIGIALLRQFQGSPNTYGFEKNESYNNYQILNRSSDVFNCVYEQELTFFQ